MCRLILEIHARLRQELLGMDVTRLEVAIDGRTKPPPLLDTIAGSPDALVHRRPCPRLLLLPNNYTCQLKGRHHDTWVVWFSDVRDFLALALR